MMKCHNVLCAFLSGLVSFTFSGEDLLAQHKAAFSDSLPISHVYTDSLSVAVPSKPDALSNDSSIPTLVGGGIALEETLALPQDWPEPGGEVGDKWEVGVVLIAVMTVVLAALWIMDDGENHNVCRAGEEDWCYDDGGWHVHQGMSGGIKVLRW